MDNPNVLIIVTAVALVLMIYVIRYIYYIRVRMQSKIG